MADIDDTGFPWPHIDAEQIYASSPRDIEAVAASIRSKDLPPRADLVRMFVGLMDDAVETLEACIIHWRQGGLELDDQEPPKPFLIVKNSLVRAAVVGHRIDWPPDLEASVNRLLYECAMCSERGWRFVYKEWPAIRSEVQIQRQASQPAKPDEAPNSRASSAAEECWGQYLAGLRRLEGADFDNTDTSQLRAAIAKHTDQDIYDAFKSEGEAMLEYGSWSRCVRTARSDRGLNKNKPRAGRTGKCIAGIDQI